MDNYQFKIDNYPLLLKIVDVKTATPLQLFYAIFTLTYF
jgi:hypothetical protein